MSAATTQFRQGVEAADVNAMLDALTADAFLRSPVAAGLRFEGRDVLAQLFAATTVLYEDVEVTHDFGDAASWLLGFRARIGRQAFQETLLMGLAEDGRIDELTAAIRPIAGVATVAGAVGQQLARRHGRVRALALEALTAPLVQMARSGDAIGPKLLRPLGGRDR